MGVFASWPHAKDAGGSDRIRTRPRTVFCVGEKTAIHTPDHKHRMLPLPPGHTKHRRARMQVC